MQLLIFPISELSANSCQLFMHELASQCDSRDHQPAYFTSTQYSTEPEIHTSLCTQYSTEPELHTSLTLTHFNVWSFTANCLLDHPQNGFSNATNL